MPWGKFRDGVAHLVRAADESRQILHFQAYDGVIEDRRGEVKAAANVAARASAQAERAG